MQNKFSINVAFKTSNSLVQDLVLTNLTVVLVQKHTYIELIERTVQKVIGEVSQNSKQIQHMQTMSSKTIIPLTIILKFHMQISKNINFKISKNKSL